MKQEFEMTRQEMDDIIAINKNQPPVMKFGDYWIFMDLQEKINHYWTTLAAKYGFKELTVEQSAKGELFFLAEPAPTALDELADDKKRLIEFAENLLNLTLPDCTQPAAKIVKLKIKSFLKELGERIIKEVGKITP